MTRQDGNLTPTPARTVAKKLPQDRIGARVIPAGAAFDHE